MSQDEIRYPFRIKSPIRACTKQYKNYQSYKDFIREDFNNRCAYTDCLDIHFGGYRTFHIDHVKPKSNFPELENSYNNLVYSCSYVNIKKSDKIEVNIDPCDIDWNDHFYRNKFGEICPELNSKDAVSLHASLCLYLDRYRFVWQIQKLDELMTKIEKMIERKGGLDHSDSDIIKSYAELSIEYRKYKAYLDVELNS